MLVEFSVGNFLSFKDPVTFSMLASAAVKELEDSSEGVENVFWDKSGKNKYLKSAVLYGANGSGKSNLIKAMGFFRSFITSSSNNSQAGDPIDVTPFLFNTQTATGPSYFEMVFFIGPVRYRYGFETKPRSASTPPR